jgi:hypothetical protein
MATSKSTPDSGDASNESAYATTAEEAKGGKPIGPEHDESFHAPDFYDPKTGKRIETPYDSEQQKADPGFDPKVMAGTVEQPQGQDKTTGASGGEGGETTKRSSS